MPAGGWGDIPLGKQLCLFIKKKRVLGTLIENPGSILRTHDQQLTNACNSNPLPSNGSIDTDTQSIY